MIARRRLLRRTFRFECEACRYVAPRRQLYWEARSDGVGHANIHADRTKVRL
jgi:hypothetical protein